VIHRLGVDSDQAEDLVLGDVDRDSRMCRVEERGALHHLQVPGSRPEPVWLGGEGTNRADLDGVAGEVGAEGVVGEGVHLGDVSPVLELDQRVAADLLGEAGATGTEDTALPVEEHQIGDRDRLLERPLDLDEAALPRPVGNCLVLEGAFAALVADRAVEGVVGEQELQHCFLGLLDRLVLSVDHHAVDHLVGAGSDQHRSPPGVYFDEAHPAHPHRLHPPMPAEPGDVGALSSAALMTSSPGFTSNSRPSTLIVTGSLTADTPRSRHVPGLLPLK
jgi:hypothetical protein